MSKKVRKKRKSYSAEEKVIIIRRHLLDKVNVSDLCDEYNIHPTIFYRWQKEFFENGALAFHGPKNQQEQKWRNQIGHLEERLQQKNEVVAELMEEHLKLKKTLGLL